MKYPLLGLFILECISLHAQQPFISNNGVRIANSAYITTNGAWTNEAGTAIINDGTIRTTASFVNQGILDPNSTGRFTLQFATDQDFQPGGYGMGSLIKLGLGAVRLTGSIHVKDSLLLKTGLLQVVNPFDTVYIQSGAIVEADTGSYVNGGFVARAGTGDLLFPLGKDGHYLPLKIYRVNAQRVTASVLDAPATHTAGPGVDALIDFPYAWEVTKSNPSDTAAHIEISYPNTLPSVTDLIVVREIPGEKYASMGARSVEESPNRITVKSYSRRLKGLFTVAQGLESDVVTDSLALVSLYQSAGGAAWTNHTNWLTGPVDTWFGITTAGQSITEVNLSHNNLKGPIPDPLADIVSLQNLDLSVNEITALPDFTHNTEITSLNVSDNHLTFASLEPNAAVTGISYLVQADIGTAIDSLIVVGTPYSFTAPAGGQSSSYKWMRNGETVADSAGASYYLPVINRENMGEYTAEVTNPNLPGLTLKSRIQKALAYADVSGKLFADSAVAAQQGEMTLYKIQSGAFAPVASVQTENDGTYHFEKIILDNYHLRGFADTLIYENVLPTYYKNTLFWETADTLSLEDHITGLEIISQLKPEALSGTGSISGYLEEPVAGGRVRENNRIAGVAVSAQRIEQASPGEADVLTLAAYDFTNEEGEFILTNLPEAEYRLNFQYPGYPMDETSFTTITIGANAESQVMVEAIVAEGKISVSQLAITGIYQAEGYSAEVYPNPTSNVIRLKFPAKVRERYITMTDMTGKMIFSIPAESRDVSVNVQSFHKGIYLLQVRENGIKVKALRISIE